MGPFSLILSDLSGIDVMGCVDVVVQSARAGVHGAYLSHVVSLHIVARAYGEMMRWIGD